MDKAYDALRKKGLAAAAKKATRLASEGLVGVATSRTSASVGPAVAIVEVNSETDFVARSEMFRGLVGQVAAAALALDGSAGTGKSSLLDEAQVRGASGFS
jgi:elongation factor Ts